MRHLIYLIALLEWFTTLSVEIVALRLFTPVVGANSISTSIVLGVVLLALSYGYYRWGIIADRGVDVEKKLVRNLLISSLYYFFVTFIFYEVLLTFFLWVSWQYFVAILLTSILLFFIPVFLASQTIPLLTYLLQWKSSAGNVGKLLFYSTIGSFLGSVGTSTVLFPLIGVSKTAIISPVFLSICAGCISYWFFKNTKYLIASIVLLLFYAVSMTQISLTPQGAIYHSSNAYHDISIIDDSFQDTRVFSLDGAYSSGISLSVGESFFRYIQEAKQHVQTLKPKKILVIGAAGFTFPQEVAQFDFVESVDVVDVDPSLKVIAEEYFLEEKLSEKIDFYPDPARFFLRNISQKYDFVFIDAYSGFTIPQQVLTKEFFEQLVGISDAIYLNLILDTDLDSDFSINTLFTIDSVFPSVFYRDVNRRGNHLTNFVVTNLDSPGYTKRPSQKGKIYSDDKNSVELDRFILTK